MAKSTRKHKHQEPSPIKAAKKLALLAEKMTLDTATEEEHFKLFSLIEHHLEHDHDEILFTALNETSSDEVLEELYDQIMDQSERILIPAGDDFGEAALFAIPVMLLVEPGKPIPQTLNDPEATAKTFRETGMIGEDHSSLLRGELLPYEDVEFGPCDKFRLVHQHLDVLFKGNNPPNIRFTEDDKALDQEQPRMILRYLLCIFISAPDAETPFEPPIEDDDYDLYIQKLDAWREIFRQSFIGNTGVDDVIVGTPQPAHIAIDEGVIVQQRTSLKLVAKKAVLAAAKKQSLCRAVASLHRGDEEEEIRLAFYDDECESLGHFVMPIVLRHHQLSDCLEIISEVMSEEGVDSIQRVPEIQPLNTCECCGEPVFPSLVKAEGDSSATEMRKLH